MRKIFYLLVIWLLAGCETHFPEVPPEINKRIIVAPQCNKVIFSSNKENYFTPYIVEDPFNSRAFKVSRLTKNKSDYFPQSISCDCRYISLVAEDKQHQTFDLYLYDTATGKLLNLTHSEFLDEGESAFSPVSPLLAFLENGLLKLYNYQTGQFIAVDPLADQRFKDVVWSVKGKFIYLEDQETNIWTYDIAGKQLQRIWRSPAPSFTVRMITPSEVSDSVFYFLSDHESEFTQIYKGVGKDSILLLLSTPYDKYLLPGTMNDTSFFYRENKDGNFLVWKYSDGKSVPAGPSKAVVYDYYYLGGRGDCILYADSGKPASLFLQQEGKDVNIAGIIADDTMPLPAVHFNASGMYNLVYRAPGIEKSEQWLVWLHGGPYEQVSIRYNTYLMQLLKSGWNIVVLNYPGSTGIGNSYELRHSNSSQMLDIQLKSIREDMLALMKEYPEIKRYAMVGVSYGTIPARHYLNKYPAEVTSLVDFSGIATVPTTADTPVLYVYGDDDYALKNPLRAELVKDDLKKDHVHKCRFSDEGHVINHRENIARSAAAINDFLQRILPGK